MSNFLDRLKTEYEELLVKVEKLDDFLHSPKFEELSVLQQGLLVAQMAAMTGYLSILALRINDLDPDWMEHAKAPDLG